MTPSSGSGQSQTFQFLVSDANGVQDLANVAVVIHNTLSSANACYFQYNVGTNTLYLATDPGDNWHGPIALGSANSVQNSQCTISGAESSVTTGGNTATFSVRITFTASFSGVRTTYAVAFDDTGRNSGWVTLGNWTVNAAPAPNVAPQLQSVTPSSGSGLSRAFQFQASDGNGHQDLSSVAVVINNTLSGTSGCYFSYEPNSNRLYLANDQNSSWLGPLTLGSSNTVQNSQCTISGSGSSTSLSGNSASFTINITFAAGFSGARTIWGLGYDRAGVNTGWVTLGTWTVGSGQVNVAPQASSVNPSSGSGASRAFQFVVSDANGYSDLANVAVVINSTLTSSSACYFQYHPNTNALYLANDQGTNWFGPLTLGSANSVQNSQCIISGTGSTISLSGNAATFTVNITFKPAFAGHRSIYVLGFDRAGLNTGWVTLGSWNVDAGQVNVAPQAMSVSPSSGSGRTNTFTFTVSDANGYQDLSNIAVVINNTISAASGCYFQFHPNSNNLYLANNSGSSWFGPISLGSSGSVSNSQCTISSAGSSVSLSGSSATFSVNITFSQSFAGSRGIYVLGFDRGGLDTGWRTLGTWTVQ
jgi:hypothetical protein